jgi:tetratricopeptide (TPR) repeat protein
MMELVRVGSSSPGGPEVWLAETKSPPAPSDRAGVLGLILLGLLPVVGRFASPTLAWGFHLTGYLPLGGWLASIAGWGLLFVPPWRRLVESLLYDRLGGALFGPSAKRAWLSALGVVVVTGGTFWLLSTPTHLLGDGVLVGEMVGKGVKFRALDGMDYLLHRLAREAIAPGGDIEVAYRIYAWGSRLAGLIGVLGAILLLRRSRLALPARVLLLMLWLLSAPTLLYCGYVESYGFLSVALLGFIWSGAMAQRGEVPPWVPGICFGFGLFFHLTALLALPALAWLVIRPGPAKVARGRWTLSLLLPATVLPLAAILAHTALGFDATWLRREFLDGSGPHSLLVALRGDHSLLSVVHWKDLANWIVLVVPVPAWLVLNRSGALRRLAREPEAAFLLVQTVCFGIAFVLLDRKLGAARDWDLFAPHVAGLGWIAARLWEPESAARSPAGPWPGLRYAAPWVALLIAWPWFAVNASRAASLQRFTEVRADFADYPRAYATQDLAKYHRDRGELERSVVLCEESVRIFPGNARFHTLLGTNYVALGRMDDAQRQFDEALRIDPGNWVVFDMRAKLALRREDYATAFDLYRRQTRLDPGNPEVWAGLGYSAFRVGDLEAARGAFQHASALVDDPQYDYYAGIACASLGRWDDAVGLFRRSVRGGKQGLYYYGLAMALEAREAAHLSAGRAVDPAALRAAAQAAALALELTPENPQIAWYRDHLARVVAGQEPPVVVPR